jgi:enamidase
MKVHAGSVILEPGLVEDDFAELAIKGVWLAKAGFGAFETPYEYAPQIGWARKHGMITTVHTGGSSIPGSSGIWADHLLAMRPHVFHVNGGPVAMPDPDFARLLHETDIALQLCTAGNLRTALWLTRMVQEVDAFDRLLIATDTPTGSGVMPLGMLYTITHLASLADVAPEVAIAAATGNNAKVYGLASGFVRVGCDADLVIIDASAGGSQPDALSAIQNGDIPAVSAVMTDGVPRFVGRSRNTPGGVRTVQVTACQLPRDFSGASH